MSNANDLDTIELVDAQIVEEELYEQVVENIPIPDSPSFESMIVEEAEWMSMLRYVCVSVLLLLLIGTVLTGLAFLVEARIKIYNDDFNSNRTSFGML